MAATLTPNLGDISMLPLPDDDDGDEGLLFDVEEFIGDIINGGIPGDSQQSVNGDGDRIDQASKRTTPSPPLGKDPSVHGTPVPVVAASMPSIPFLPYGLTFAATSSGSPFSIAPHVAAPPPHLHGSVFNQSFAPPPLPPGILRRPIPPHVSLHQGPSPPPGLAPVIAEVPRTPNELTADEKKLMYLIKGNVEMSDDNVNAEGGKSGQKNVEQVSESPTTKENGEPNIIRDVSPPEEDNGKKKKFSRREKKRLEQEKLQAFSLQARTGATAVISGNEKKRVESKTDDSTDRGSLELIEHKELPKAIVAKNEEKREVASSVAKANDKLKEKEKNKVLKESGSIGEKEMEKVTAIKQQLEKSRYEKAEEKVAKKAAKNELKSVEKVAKPVEKVVEKAFAKSVENPKVVELPNNNAAKPTENVNEKSPKKSSTKLVEKVGETVTPSSPTKKGIEVKIVDKIQESADKLKKVQVLLKSKKSIEQLPNTTKNTNNQLTVDKKQIHNEPTKDKKQQESTTSPATQPSQPIRIVKRGEPIPGMTMDSSEAAANSSPTKSIKQLSNDEKRRLEALVTKQTDLLIKSLMEERLQKTLFFTFVGHKDFSMLDREEFINAGLVFDREKTDKLFMFQDMDEKKETTNSSKKGKKPTADEREMAKRVLEYFDPLPSVFNEDHLIETRQLNSPLRLDIAEEALRQARQELEEYEEKARSTFRANRSTFVNRKFNASN